MLFDNRCGGLQVVEGCHEHIGADTARNAVTVGQRTRKWAWIGRGAGKLSDVVPTMPASLELQNLVTPGEGSRDSQSGKSRLAAGGLKANSLATRHVLNNQLGQSNRRLV